MSGQKRITAVGDYVSECPFRPMTLNSTYGRFRNAVAVPAAEIKPGRISALGRRHSLAF